MRRSFQWMLSLLAISGLTSATAAQAQPSNHSGPHVATNLGHQLDLDGGPRTDGTAYP